MNTNLEELEEDLKRAEALRGREARDGFDRVWSALDGNEEPSALFLRGRIKFLLQEDDLALEFFKKATDSDPTLHRAHSNAGLLLRYLDRNEEALDRYKLAENAAVESGADSMVIATYVKNEAEVQKAMGDLTGAEAALRRAISLNQSICSLHIALGAILRETDRVEESKACLQHAVECHREQRNAQQNNTIGELDVPLLFNLGITYANQNDAANALDSFKLALAGSPNDWRVMSKIVQCQSNLGLKEERDEMVKELYDLRGRGLVNSERFCREQITTDYGNILVLEWFEFSGEFYRPLVAMLWETGPNLSANPSLKLPSRVSLGSYDRTTDIARELGQIDSTKRFYHLDAYFDGGAHTTLGMFYVEEAPDYDSIRNTMLDGMLGRAEAVSSFHPGTKPGISLGKSSLLS